MIGQHSAPIWEPGDGVLEELKFSTKEPSTKKKECLTDVLNNDVLNWETVVRVVAHH